MRANVTQKQVNWAVDTIKDLLREWHRLNKENESLKREIQQYKEKEMSYSVNTPCRNCQLKKEGCTDGIVVTGAVQGIIHSTPYVTGAHKGSGSVTLDCMNKKEIPAE